jgi:alpha-tubulin suppressor-like RCC1 family protein
MEPEPMTRLHPSLPAWLLLGAALGACGGTLYDAAGVPAIDRGGTVCKAPNHVCGGECVGQTVGACGSGCLVCAAPSAVATPTCQAGGGGAYACGYTCPPGLLVCPGGCCHPTAVAAGAAHACAITAVGSLVCWGSNDRGQLGPGASGTGSTRPAQVFADKVTAVAAGGRHTCAVRDGAVLCWGDNQAGQLGTGTASAGGATPLAAGVAGATALALGTTHSCALVAGGGVTCWGANALGQLGHGDTAAHPGLKATPLASGARLLAAGADTTCADLGGPVRCWGADDVGQAGAGPGGATRPPRASPGAVAGLPGAPPASLAVGHRHACAAFGQPDGLWCWGANDSAQLGTGATGAPATSPVQASRLDNGQRSSLVAAGGGHTCSAKDALELKCGGLNDQQQAGVPSPNPAAEGLAVSLGGNLVTASAGGDFTCALVEAAGAVGVKCWGGNSSGQLGRDSGGSSAGTPEFVSP